MASRYHRLLYILAPSAVATYAIDCKLSALEERYPTLPVNNTTCSPALRTPNSPSTQHSPHIDIYSARIPLASLTSGTFTPEELQSPPALQNINATLSTKWAQAVFRCRILRWEGSVFGLLSKRGFQPGDIGASSQGGFDPLPDSPDDADKGSKDEKRILLNGVMVVEHPPSLDNPYGLLASWKVPDEPRLFFEKIAGWGYPWRLMSGGRHELSVSKPFYVPGREEDGLVVEVRFASAHDYEIFPEEGGLGRQKTIPGWTARLHRGYARFILDQAVREEVERG